MQSVLFHSNKYDSKFGILLPIKRKWKHSKMQQKNFETQIYARGLSRVIPGVLICSPSVNKLHPNVASYEDAMYSYIWRYPIVSNGMVINKWITYKWWCNRSNPNKEQAIIQLNQNNLSSLFVQLICASSGIVLGSHFGEP